MESMLPVKKSKKQVRYWKKIYFWFLYGHKIILAEYIDHNYKYKSYEKRIYFF